MTLFDSTLLTHREVRARLDRPIDPIVRRRKNVKYRRKNRERILRYERERRQRCKMLCIKHYGPVCVYCPPDRFNDYAALTLDHKNGDGAEDRKRHGNSCSWVRAVLRGFPDTFVMCCWNCNSVKGTMSYEMFMQRQKRLYSSNMNRADKKALIQFYIARLADLTKEVYGESAQVIGD